MSVIVEVPAPGAAMDVGLKLAVVPDGRPEALNAIAALKLPEIVVVIVLVPKVPCAMLTEDGEALIVKFGVPPAVTVSETEVVSVLPPPVPVTAIA